MQIEQAEIILREEFVEDSSWLSPELLQRLVSYAVLLSEWSHRVDLVAPASSEVIFNRHIVDSLCAWFQLRNIIQSLSPEQSILDVGSGAGLPGAVFAMVEPNREVRLCEPREKRQIFLQHLKSRLELNNVRLLQCRLEDLRSAPDAASGLAICRALGMELEYLKGCGELGVSKIVQMLGPNQTASQDSVLLSLGQVLKSAEIVYEVRILGAKRLIRVWECST